MTLIKEKDSKAQYDWWMLQIRIEMRAHMCWTRASVYVHVCVTDLICTHLWHMQKHEHTHTVIFDIRTLRSSASGSGCPWSSSLCRISSSSSFSLFLSRSSASISFSRSLRRFCSALPLKVAPEMSGFRPKAIAPRGHPSTAVGGA